MRKLAVVAAALLLAALLLPAYAADLQSGLEVGSVCPPFQPHHVAGADKDTNTCPV